MPSRNVTIRSMPGQRGHLPPRVRVLSSKRAFHGAVFDVYSDVIAEPGGTPHRKDVIRHNGSVVILPIQYPRHGEPLILLERQYRHATGRYLWELPAGRIEPGERPLTAARRELAEETGYSARRWKKLIRYYASPGFLAEWMQIYLAEDLTPGDDSPDPDEIIRHQFFPLSKALRMVDTNRLLDAKTMLALLLYEKNHKHKRRYKSAVDSR
jgi:ADP-ribose pyrophosphatase